MIRCVRIGTGRDGHCLCEEGNFAMPGTARGDLASLTERAASLASG